MSEQQHPTRAGATGYVYDPIFLQHSKTGHAEHAQRLETILSALDTAGLRELLRAVPARPATQAELLAGHSREHLHRVQESCRAGGGQLDADTYTTPQTYAAASMAAGSVIALTLAALAGEIKNGFACVRPPGHHATRDQALGFCLFNNVALAAKAAQIQRQVERVAIVDFDVHHGNGTQALVERDPQILFISTHQMPLYPGTGEMRETGGARNVINIPLAFGSGDQVFKRVYQEIVVPAVTRFAPQLILVSAGYDAHWGDPLASLGLTLTGQAWLAQTLVALAETVCAGRIVLTLEGGYNLKTLGIGVANTVRALLGRADMADPAGLSPRIEPDVTPLIAALKTLHQL